MSGAEILVATRNPAKRAELRRIMRVEVPDLVVIGLDDVDAYDEPVETEPTFAGNALLKARAALAATGLPALADDSGLCVDALSGMPGVLSARWSGASSDEANNALLLAQLRDVPDPRLGAVFRCAVAYCRPDGTVQVVHGEVRGRLLREPRGNRGFGYDPLFVPDGHSRTTAEMGSAEKDALSHRGRALRLVAPLVAASPRR